VTSYRVKADGRIVLDKIRTLAAAKFTARHEGGDVLAVDSGTGVSWKVGSWEVQGPGQLTKWVQVGPKS
jgi:hypothetical protein